MRWHVLDVSVVFKRVALVLLPDISVYVRFHEYLLHFVIEGDHETPTTELVVALLASLAFVVQDNVVLSMMLEGEDVGIGLEGEELSGSDDQSAVIGGIQEVELGGDLYAE